MAKSSSANDSLKEWRKFAELIIPISAGFLLNELWLKESILFALIPSTLVFLYYFFIMYRFSKVKNYPKPVYLFLLGVGLLVPILFVYRFDLVNEIYGKTIGSFLAALMLVLVYIFMNYKSITRETIIYQGFIVSLVIFLSMVFSALFSLVFSFLPSFGVADSRFGFISIVMVFLVLPLIVFLKAAKFLYPSKRWKNFKDTFLLRN